MANAAGSKGSRGDVAPSQQGRAGLRLQNALPDARILYVSATGATTLAGLGVCATPGTLGHRRNPVRETHRLRHRDGNRAVWPRWKWSRGI